MRIEISQHNATRVRDAVHKRAELLRMTTHEMPRDWLDEMQGAETTIAAAVAHALKMHDR